MGIYRRGKDHAYNSGSGADGTGAYVFDALQVVQLPVLTTSLGAGVSINTVQTYLLLPQRCVVAGVETYTGGTTGTATFNLVVGTGAPSGSSGSAQTLQVANASVFATAPTLPAAGGAAFFVPDVPEAWYDRGTLLTLRCTTVASTGAITAPIIVSVLLAPMDPNCGKTQSGSGAIPGTDF